jgi:hypothetical protein
LALHSTEVENEASLKIAEFLYYGTSGLKNHTDALAIYKLIEELNANGEIRGHSLFKLGMIYQFGSSEDGI